MQQPEVGRERVMISGKWVIALMEERSLDPMEIAFLTKKHVGTIYGWRKKGMEYLDWCGLLALLGEKPEWKPTEKKK